MLLAVVAHTYIAQNGIIVDRLKYLATIHMGFTTSQHSFHNLKGDDGLGSGSQKGLFSILRVDYSFVVGCDP